MRASSLSRRSKPGRRLESAQVIAVWAARLLSRGVAARSAEPMSSAPLLSGRPSLWSISAVRALASGDQPSVPRSRWSLTAYARSSASRFLPPCGRGGLLLQAVGQARHASRGLLGPVAGRAVADTGRAVRSEPVERRLDRLDLRHLLLVEVLGRIDGRFEDEPSDVRRVQVGVDRAERRSVRDAEVVQPLVAEEVAHQVEVARGVRGADVREERPGVLGAGVGPVVAGVVRGLPAAHGDGRANAARVEGDQVVAVEERLVLVEEFGQSAHAGHAGAAEVEDERADAPGVRAGGLAAYQGDVDRPAIWFPVVEGAFMAAQS